MPRTVQQIDAAIDALETAKIAKLGGSQVSKVSYDGSITTEFSIATVEQIEMELMRLRMERSRLTGERFSAGPVIARFGSR